MATAAAASLRRAKPQATKIFKNAILYEPCNERANVFAAQPKMVLLFTWLGAKERYAHKFVQSWTNHGFHVMHVTTNVLDLLMPKSKSEVTVNRVVDHLLTKDQFNVIIHGLSVGGYLGSRVVMESSSTDLAPRITHQVFDSFMNTAGLQDGVIHAVEHPWNKIAGKVGELYYQYADLSVFRKTETFLETNPSAIPTYYMHSMGDHVARYTWIQKFIEAQSEKSKTSVLLLPEEQKIPHVGLFRKLGEGPYMSSIFRFFQRNNLIIDTDYCINQEAKELIPLEKEIKANLTK